MIREGQVSMHWQQKHQRVLASAANVVSGATLYESAGATTSSADDIPVNETHESVSGAEKSAYCKKLQSSKKKY